MNPSEYTSFNMLKNNSNTFHGVFTDYDNVTIVYLFNTINETDN